MDEGRALAVLVDVLEIDDELGRVVFRVREDLGAVERDDVVGDDLDVLGREVVVVDAEVGVKPVHLVCDEFAGDEALHVQKRNRVRFGNMHIEAFVIISTR